MSIVGLTRAACLVCATCRMLSYMFFSLFFFFANEFVPLSCLLDDETFGGSVNIQFSSLKF